MKAVVDIGNTRTKAAFYEGGKCIKITENEQDSKAFILLNETHISTILIASSGNEENFTVFLSNLKIPFSFLNHATPLPLKINYQTPETLGLDRIAVATSAANFFPNQPVLCITAGTCLTFNFISNEGVFEGGAISPGIQMRLNALHTFTDKLPTIQFDTQISPFLIGKNTQESILSGVLNGVKAEIEYFIESYIVQKEVSKVLITGGDSHYLQSIVKKEIFVRPNLVLEGLHIILCYNEENFR